METVDYSLGLSPDLINGVGVSLIMFGFILNQLDYIDSRGKLYLWLNAIGSGLACWGAWVIGSIPFVVLEGVWMAISLIGIFFRKQPAAVA